MNYADITVFWSLLASFIGLSKAALAEPLTFYFEGEVRFIDETLALDDSVFVGAPFTGGYTFDPTGATDSYPEAPAVGNYAFASGRLWARIGNYEFRTPDLIIFLLNDPPPSGDLYEAISVTPFQAGGLQWGAMNVVLGDRLGTALDSDALPLDVPDLADYPTFRRLNIDLPSDTLGIRGTLTSLTPEPSSLAILALGACLIAGRRRLG